MRIDVLLADSAQAVQGKLYILGGGWTDTTHGPEQHTIPHALAVLVHVPWDQVDRPHQLVADLLDVDGNKVLLGESGDDPVQLVMDFEVTPAPGVDPGTSLPVPFAANIGPLPLQPGRYTWDLCVDAQPLQQADISFSVHTMPEVPDDARNA